MNQKELLIQRKKVWRSYHVPGMGNYTTRPVNAIFLSPKNTWEHEMWKAKVCHEILKKGMKFVTEAVCNKTGDRADIIVLDTGDRIEVETTKRRAKRFESKESPFPITVIATWAIPDPEKWELII